MDPNATLKMALEAIKDEDRETAVETLKNLAEWFDKGGFFPKLVHYKITFVETRGTN